jgi:hypothetical protein
MSEAEERIEYSDVDRLDLARLGLEPDGQEPTFHPILQIWQAVLQPSADVLTQKVTPQWANRIITAYVGLDFYDMELFRNKYFTKMADLAAILDLEVASDDECLTYTDPADDARHNSHHYKNLLLQWQQQILQWEMDWTCTDDDAATELAAISEVHKFFFGQTGLTAFLDNIGFEFTEDDTATLRVALEEFKEGAGE